MNCKNCTHSIQHANTSLLFCSQIASLHIDSNDILESDITPFKINEFTTRDDFGGLCVSQIYVHEDFGCILFKDIT